MAKSIPAGAYGGPAIHPGEVLREDFMVPHNLSRNQLAVALHVPVMRVSEICAGKRRITAETAMRLGRYFHTSPEFWMNLQIAHDLREALDRFPEAVSDVIPLATAS